MASTTSSSDVCAPNSEPRNLPDDDLNRGFLLSLGTIYLTPGDSTPINPKYLCRACYFAGELPTFSGSNHISVCVHCYAEIQPTLLRFPLTSTTRTPSPFT